MLINIAEIACGIKFETKFPYNIQDMFPIYVGNL